MKLLSIIVPSYNMEKFLPKCLGSLVGIEKLGRDSRSTAEGSYLDLLDVIVVNDGSKDRTSEIAHEFEAKYPGVFRVIDKPNGNYGSCINAALPVARGRFVKILDADDTYDTVAFSKYLQVLEKLPADTDMVMNDYVHVDEAGAVIETKTYHLPSEVGFTVKTLVENKCMMAMHAVAYKVELLRRIWYVQTEGISYTDTEFCYMPAAYSALIYYVQLPVYRYFVGRSGQTMELMTWIKNSWMMDRIFKRMCKQYDEGKSSGLSRAYLEMQLQQMFEMTLSLHLDNPHLSVACDYIKIARMCVDEYPFLKDILKDRVVFVRMPFRFYYVDFLVGHPSMAYCVLPAVRLYNSLRSKLFMGD